MSPLPDKVKNRLRIEASNSDYFKTHLSHKKLDAELKDIEYYAINWALYHEKALALKTEFSSASIYFYDEIMENPRKEAGMYRNANIRTIAKCVPWAGRGRRVTMCRSATKGE